MQGETKREEVRARNKKRKMDLENFNWDAFDFTRKRKALVGGTGGEAGAVGDALSDLDDEGEGDDDEARDEEENEEELLGLYEDEEEDDYAQNYFDNGEDDGGDDDGGGGGYEAYE